MFRIFFPPFFLTKNVEPSLNCRYFFYPALAFLLLLKDSKVFCFWAFQIPGFRTPKETSITSISPSHIIFLILSWALMNYHTFFYKIKMFKNYTSTSDQLVKLSDGYYTSSIDLLLNCLMLDELVFITALPRGRWLTIRKASHRTTKKEDFSLSGMVCGYMALAHLQEWAKAFGQFVAHATVISDQKYKGKREVAVKITGGWSCSFFIVLQNSKSYLVGVQVHFSPVLLVYSVLALFSSFIKVFTLWCCSALECFFIV